MWFTILLLFFRIMSDKETGKPSGYAFCEFRDSETAESAVRNLNGHEFNGRTIRVTMALKERMCTVYRGLCALLTGLSYADRGGGAKAGGVRSVQLSLT